MHDLSLFYSRFLRISERNLEFEAIFGYHPDHPPNKVNPKPRSKKTKKANPVEPVRRSNRIRETINYCEWSHPKKEKSKQKVVQVKSVDIFEKQKSGDTGCVTTTAQFICELCKKEYNHMNSLAKHMKSTHSKVQFNCDSCEKSFSYQSNLKRHVDLKHSSVKVNYSCSYCVQLFSYSCTLKKHIKLYHM